MKNYILEKLRCDARHVLELAKQEQEIQHSGLKGRFRELLIDNFLASWLPPYVSCGTGTIIAAENEPRKFSQDDIILYDKSLCPPVMASNNAPEGVFLYNSVLARIEVKSKLTAGDINNFIDSSKEISELKFSVNLNSGETSELSGAFNLLFAFDSDLTFEKEKQDKDLYRLLEKMDEKEVPRTSGIISMLCVAEKGFWKIGVDDSGNRCWQRLDTQQSEDYLVWFLGCISNSCFQQHCLRQGRNYEKSLESGIGMYLEHPFTNIECQDIT